MDRNENEFDLCGDNNIIANIGLNSPVCIQEFRKNGRILYEIIGLDDYIGYNIEINLNLDVNEIFRLLPEIIYNIIEKEILLENDLITSELTGAPVQIKIGKPLVELKNISKVARLIFSDEDYRLPDDFMCNIAYKVQTEKF